MIAFCVESRGSTCYRNTNRKKALAKAKRIVFRGRTAGAEVVWYSPSSGRRFVVRRFGGAR